MFIVACGNLQFANRESDYWFLYYDEEYDVSGYLDTDKQIQIDFGEYTTCYTDTFKQYAIVLHHDYGFIGINRKQKILFRVYPFDNGPDYPQEGMFRIVEDGKIGYVRASDGKIVIAPKYACAYPFEDGKAKVTDECEVIKEGEHSVPQSDSWYYIDHRGKAVE